VSFCVNQAALVNCIASINEDRNIEEAQAMMAVGCKIEFPGARNFNSRAKMISNAKGRNNRVRNHRVRYFVESNRNRTSAT